jgi:hypothetical protein
MFDASVQIDTLLNGVKQAYIDQQNAQGIRSSGKSASSLRTESDSDSGALYGSAYFYQQKHGRKPGKFPPIDDILDWIRVKGIRPKDKISDRSLAFLIARKIAQSGTDVFQGKRDGLDVEDRIKQLVEQFKKDFVKAGRKEIIKQIKTSAI